MPPILHEAVEQSNKSRLSSYDADARSISEHFGIEETVLAGGYGYRQILELVQNGADALLEAQHPGASPEPVGRIHVQLSGSHLYVANTGASLSVEGLNALLSSHLSPKRGNQIGRFGLGFKSLLRLDGRIDIFTRGAGDIRFDPRRCREEIRRRYQVDRAPALRLAWPLPPTERAEDAICAELSWAETIIRVEVGSGDLVGHIQQEIRSFPAEFLLFFPVPTRLTLEDGEAGAREVRLTIERAEHVLHDGDAVSRWRLAMHEVRIDDPRAVADATHLHARESVPVSWAMPLEGRREEVGRFWAFFPTHTQTYLPGILNAPWKLNSDRNAIIGGEWNRELMAAAAQLIADTLPSLWSPEDPARPLDAFPRQLDRRDEDAAPLVESLWGRLKDATVIPDCTGALRRANELFRHPKDTHELASAWQSLAGAQQRGLLVHPSCLERQRASRLNALAERLEAPSTDIGNLALRRCSTVAWFAMVATVEAETALRVLKMAESLSGELRPNEWSLVRETLVIVPTRSGGLATSAAVVLAPDDVEVPDRESVAADFLSIADTRRLLKDVLRVRELDNQLWQRILEEAAGRISTPQRESDDENWRALWARLRLAPEAVAKAFIDAAADDVAVRARRCDGKWVEAREVLLPGTLVPESDEENAGVLVDRGYHSGDAALLQWLGVRPDLQGSESLSEVQERPLYRGWKAACVKKWNSDAYQPGGARPHGWYLQPLDGVVPRGLDFLVQLQGAALGRLTLIFCNRLVAEGKHVVAFGHATTPRAYPKAVVSHPLPWLLLSHGEVRLLSGPSVPLRALVARREEPAIQRLSIWPQLEPVLRILSEHTRADLIKPGDLRALWRAAIGDLATPASLGGEGLSDLWIGAARDGVVPSDLPTQAGRVPMDAVFVTTSADLARRAVAPGRVIVVLDSSSMDKWLQAGARDLAGLVRAEWEGIIGSPERLLDVFPDLGEVLRDEAREVARCQRVSRLHLRVGDMTEAVPCLMREGALLLDGEQLAPLSRSGRLERLLTELAATGWLDATPIEALARLGDAGLELRRARVAAGGTLGERLLLAVGDRPEPLLAALGHQLSDLDLVRECSPQQLAEVALAQLGPAILVTLRSTLQAEGLKPPDRWGTPGALAFVRSIGFPPHFAASAETRREPEEVVSGPIELPPLHNFQKEVFQGLQALLSSGTKRRRAVVSLPTGGGKTRVTVEAAVRLVLEPAGHLRRVLWIAQTDELCEQAVQAFRQVWVNHGAERTNLRIARLWGGNPNPVSRDLDKPVVVVASIQTLSNRIGNEDLDWLRKAGLVVVDECHHAITPSYTALLRWLDAEASRPGAPERDEPPIVGLSATPFRTDDDESQRLARRFDSRWLPSDQEELYARLRSQGVLANAIYESLDSEAGLTAEEIGRLTTLPEPWEGLDFENLLEAINQRLAGDASRNELLVKSIADSTEQAILFFTNSVAHAEEMSVRLNLSGISAAAISGSTPTTSRRFFLDRFQNGEIRVLCNHSVLTTGFDAPKTDMVLIARQVFSPVRYMQMVGRGLRGTENCGTPSCRIVTVMDNLGRFEDKHPYHYCRRLYGTET
ncbi:DEAD/DEAH box helicase [Gemmatimonas sp.]|uniref:DEAD/DEAH box helicase n=1 Tax=Gemmatimonas sp. TaxID=1962908 RepID=UPI0037C19049